MNASPVVIKNPFGAFKFGKHVGACGEGTTHHHGLSCYAQLFLTSWHP
jgi:hypothetical protein